MRRRLGTRVGALALLAVLSWPACVGGEEPVDGGEPKNGRYLVLGVYSVWLKDTTDDNRTRIDDFMPCLIHGSTLNRFWQGEAGLEYRRSFVVDPPPHQLTYEETEPWLEQAWYRGELARDERDDRSVYVVFASAADISLRGSACGRTAVQRVGGQDAAIIFVRNYPLCWPTGDRLRNETQLATHELVEGVDRLLGYAPCAGDGNCEGRFSCGDPCDTFVGLTCPGAPTGTWTGCHGGQVDGWVIQKLGTAGRRWENCEQCMTCDFTPITCTNEDPDCAAVPEPTWGDVPKAPAGGVQPASW